jgi:hypothetical protein
LRHAIIRHHPGLLAEKERDARERSEDYSMSMHFVHTSESSLYHTTGKQLIAKLYLSCWRVERSAGAYHGISRYLCAVNTLITYLLLGGKGSPSCLSAQVESASHAWNSIFQAESGMMCLIRTAHRQTRGGYIVRVLYCM